MNSEEFPNLEDLSPQVADLQEQKQSLESEIAALQEQKNQLQTGISRLVEDGLTELEQRKQALLIAIEQLERRRDRLEQEMRSNFAGVSQDLAIRVQGFKDYLVGSLQDLAATAEQLELSRADAWENPPETQEKPQLSQKAFNQEKQQIRQLIDQYRNRPDYYGPPWQLRRTFEPIHAERLENWLINQGGRGAIRSMGSRLQNILIASAAISIMYKMHGDRARSLILADSPERLGEWRRGLQDCLGISRSDFGPNRGIILFESPEALAQKAERTVEEREQPLIIIDEMEEQVSLSLLQFPLWLAFAPEPQQAQSNYLY
ncbi:DUF3086 domain-containing protein [Gloeocapsa sp. PCC 73106]|uniref:DUF3086 domain-containing protein n=1 Tax=Gloeocapsa sp. PCC 73106 TaxID=102232 RepID=UPI0002ABED4F|nr:DUF3086 domain-containing protein [Gloeocapsa sp. PCC 73106]ELR97532.1 Protein of unknown function (DUF3086) [Gloeocapsa sp. PCC 73106]